MHVSDDELYADNEVAPPPAKKKGGNFVHFYKRPKQDKAETLKQGRPIVKMVEYVKITVPGERDEVDKPVQDRERERYPKEYAAFLANKQEELEGTLLTAWGGVPPERIEEFAYRKIKTVEQLAELTDGNLQKFGPGTLKERERARDYIKVMAGQAPVAQLRSQLEQETEKREALEAQLAALQAAFNKSQGEGGEQVEVTQASVRPKRARKEAEQ
jgi:hypothetical protein